MAHVEGIPEAIVALRSLIAEYPEGPRAYYMLATCLKMTGELGNAIDSLKTAITLLKDGGDTFDRQLANHSAQNLDSWNAKLAEWEAEGKAANPLK